MPNTRPGTGFHDGVCDACRNFKKIRSIDWDVRKRFLKKVCDGIRRDDGGYDCIVPVSGGKNSHVQVKIVKEDYSLNPLLVTVCDPFSKTDAGRFNAENIGDVFGCDHVYFSIPRDVFVRATRLGFEEWCEPLVFIETLIYTYPFILAGQLGIPMVFFGEGEFELGSDRECFYGDDFVRRKFDRIDPLFWKGKGFSDSELFYVTPPKGEGWGVVPRVGYLGYCHPWDSDLHYRIASRWGFRDVWHEWRREGYLECYEQIDSVGYLVHLWLKYPKFGFQRVSDIVGKRIRYGHLSYREGKRIVDENDWRIDRRSLDDFCNLLGYSIPGFWDVVEGFWNRDIFKKDRFGVWRFR